MNFNLWFIDLSKRETIFCARPEILVRSLLSKMKSLDSAGFSAYRELFRALCHEKKNSSELRERNSGFHEFAEA